MLMKLATIIKPIDMKPPRSIIFLISFVLLAGSSLNAQKSEQERVEEKNIEMSLSVGIAYPQGLLNSDSPSEEYAGFAENGFAIQYGVQIPFFRYLSAGGYFNFNILPVNNNFEQSLSASGINLEHLEIGNWTTGFIGIGPSFSFPENTSFSIQADIACGLVFGSSPKMTYAEIFGYEYHRLSGTGGSFGWYAQFGPSFQISKRINILLLGSYFSGNPTIKYRNTIYSGVAVILDETNTWPMNVEVFSICIGAKFLIN